MPSNVLNTMSSTTNIVSNDHHFLKSPTKRNHVHHRSLMLISLQLQHEQILQYHHFYHNLFTYQVSVGTLTTTVTQHRVDPTLIQATPHHNSKIARSNLTGFESHLDKALFTLNFSACSAPALNRSLLNSMLSCGLVAVRFLNIISLQFPGCNIDQETAYAASVSTPPLGMSLPQCSS